MTFLFNNRGVSHLSFPITDSDTEIRIPWEDFNSFMRSNAAAGDIMYAVLRGPMNREIVAIDLINSFSSTTDKYLKVARAQGGTSSMAWPAGTLLFISTHAEHYEAVFQPDEARQIDFNPNGVLSPNYQGEKIFQYTGCEIRWWQSFDAVNPYWHLIAGDPCGNEDFTDPGWGFKVWIPGVEGDFNLLDTVKNHTYHYFAHKFGDFLISGGYFGDGISSYSVDGSGNMTLVDTLPTAPGSYVQATDNGSFLLVVGLAGLTSIAVSPAGVMTVIDNLKGQNSNHNDVIVQGFFIFVAAEGGLLSYSIDGAGNLSYHDFATGGGLTNGVAGDGTFIYIASRAVGRGIQSHSVDGSGNLTVIDFHNQYPGLTWYHDVVVLGNYIYVCLDSEVLTYEADGSGNLTYLATSPEAIFGHYIITDGQFLFVTARSGRLYSLIVGPGPAVEVKDIELDPTGFRNAGLDDDFLYVGRYTDGVSSYEIV